MVKKLIWLGTLLVLIIFFWQIRIYQTKDRPERELLVKVNSTTTYLLKKDDNKTFHYHPKHSGIIEVDIEQCNLDIEIHFTDTNGKKIIADRPTRRRLNESFLVNVERGKVFSFNVIVIDPEFKEGYSSIVIRNRKENDFFRKKLQAERYYFSGFQNQMIPTWKAQNLALENYQHSLNFSNKINDTKNIAESLLRIGKVKYSLGKPSEAINFHFQALDLFLNLNDTFRIAFTYHEIASCYQYLQKTSSAIHYYNQSLNHWRKIKNSATISSSYVNISSLYQKNGSPLLQGYYLDLAKEALGFESNFEQKLNVYLLLGEYFLSRGKNYDAISHFNKALGLYEKTGNTTNEAFLWIFINLGNCYKQLGDIDEARKYTLKGIEYARSLEKQDVEGVANWILGNLEQSSGDLDKSLEYFNKALKLVNEDWIDNIYLSLGKVTFFKSKNSQLNDKVSNILKDRALSFLNEVNKLKSEPLIRARANYWKAMIHWELKSDVALTFLKNGITIIENEREQILELQSQISYFSTQIQAYQLLLDILVEGPHSPTKPEINGGPFQTTEKIRARALLDSAGGQNFDDAGLPTLEEVQEYHRLLFEMEEQFHDDQAIAAMEQQLVPLAIKMARLDPTANVVEPEAIQSADAIVEAIDDPETLLVSYAFGLEDLYLLALDTSGLKIHNLGNPRGVETQVTLIHEYLKTHPLKRNGTSHQEYEQALAGLGETLLRPLGDLQNKKRLVFIPDRFLQLLPIGALPFTKETAAPQPLLANFEIAVLPSASVWKALQDRAAKQRPTTKSIAVLADPVFNQADARLRGKQTLKDTRPFLAALPQTKREAEAIAKMAGKEAHLVSGFDANRPFATSDFLSDFRYLHFATHTEIDPENPNQSGLIFSRFDASGQPIDGALRLSDISQLELRASLVTLSACETAQGKMIRGEGLMSLARGFMAAGVPRVVGTLWKVPDDATSHFMIRFYEGLFKRNATPAQALRQAQQALQQDARWQDPHFWAGFILIGDWQ